MISHRIVVYKPPVYVPPPTTVHTVFNNAFKTQEEYTEYLNKIPFNVWDFVSLTPAQATSINQLHRITRIEQEFNRVIYSRYGPPNVLHVLSLNLTMPTPWARWDNPTGYRLISQKEFNEFILPNNDKLQDHCKQYG